MLLMEKLYLNMSVEKTVNLEFDFSSSFYILGVYFRDTVPCSSKKHIQLSVLKKVVLHMRTSVRYTIQCPKVLWVMARGLLLLD